MSDPVLHHLSPTPDFAFASSFFKHVLKAAIVMVLIELHCARLYSDFNAPSSSA